MRNSKIIIAKGIKLDKEYRNVLDFNETQMLELVNTNKVAEANTYSFIRDNGTISVNFSFSDCIYCDYMAFQNPDYDNKWFFAFIDDATYLNDGVTEIHFTIDVWATWFGRLTTKPCFVVREHVNDDTIGLHTVPENLELGDYVTNGTDTINFYNGYDIIMAVTKYPSTRATSGENVGGEIYNGVFGGFTYITGRNINGIKNIIKSYADSGTSSAIQSIFLVPKGMLEVDSWVTVAGWQYNVEYGEIAETSDAWGLTTTGFDKPTTLAGNYTPVNKKLLTWPYCYLNVDNNVGNCISLKYEDFSTAKIYFDIIASATPGCSIKIAPNSYKGGGADYTNYLYAFTHGKIPICSWANDIYTNWLTQNGINIGLNILGSTLQIASGTAMLGSGAGSLAGAGQIANGTMGIAQTVGQVYQHSLIPPSLEGNINSADVTFAEGIEKPICYHMSIKPEYARIIDNYFNLYGYKVNITKVPNITGRQNYNYIQIADSENLGYGDIPAKAIDMINKIARRGVTIWHNHTNLGDFSVSNNII